MFNTQLFSVVAFTLVSTSLAAIGPITDLHIVNAAVTPDGYTRQAVLAEGVFPGPLITGLKGNNFQLNVINELTNETMLKSTTIHWHGLFQHGTNWADGPAFVTQCPIATGNSFLYDFTVPDQAGTFWYHSHLATQYCDGLRGPLVVYDLLDPHLLLYDVDDDSTVITLADWYHTAATLEASPFPASDNTLINGLGPNLDGSTSDLSVITVTFGLRYRFRLVNIACDPNMIFTIDGHSDLTVIEADGVNTEPLTVDSIQIYAAQRYSFVLNANQPIDNYWIRADANIGPEGLAILRYLGAPNTQPTTNQTSSSNPLVENNLHPLTNPAAPGQPTLDGVDTAIALDLTFAGANFFINNVSFVPPTVPVLLQILSGAQSAADLLPAGSVYTLPSNSTIQITMPGGVIGGGHPFHLHGHTFSVIRSAGNSSYNYVNPVQRDTVNIGLAGDEVTIRFVTDNPGPWFLHCHIDWHLQAGFAVVMAEDTGATATVDVPSPAWSSLCPIYSALSPSDL
ncbi:laccase 1 [Amylocystis lapponica]|nr:laccase 1 [Amylocystis lapponica]